ncbi:5,10-methylene tetrahydromethanopterin reductase [Mycobacterium sp. SWH-M5]|nr:5,10-methylene tetrahydromethanopterin reductase [Mycobacterium sp. SWH-M5]
MTQIEGKVRFGVGLGADTAPGDLPAIVDHLERSGADSVWFSELVYSPAVDPFIGMAYTLSRTTRLKAGTSVAILPGRHPVLVAKQVASLAALAPKRVLPVFGLHSALPAERDVFAVPRGRRGAVFDESLELLRAVLGGRDVSFDGEFFTIRSADVQPVPARPVDIWLGGSGPVALARIGRLADGWLGSFLTPAEAGAARRQIEREADAAGREIEPDHYGISLAVAAGEIPDDVHAMARRRRPDIDPSELIAADWPTLHRRIDEYVDAGLTKFVIRAVGRGDREAFLERFVGELLPRQN